MTSPNPSSDPNAWRTATPGSVGWPRSARAGAPNKYFIVSADTHANEPAGLWRERIDAKYRNRLPRIEVDANGVRWSVMEGFRPQKLRDSKFVGEDLVRSKAGAEPELMEEYTYLNLKLNNGFTDADFDIKNPNYRFK